MGLGTPATLGGTNSAASSATLSLTTSADAPAGSVIIVVVQQNAGSGGVTSITDGTNTYTQKFTRWDATQSCGLDVWSSVALGAQLNSGSSIVAHFSPNSSTTGIQACYCTGIDNASDVTNYTEFTAGSTSPTVATGTMAYAVELIIGCVAGFGAGSNITPTDNSPFTQLGAQHGYAAQGATVSMAYAKTTTTSSVTYAPTFSGTLYGDIAVVSFRGYVDNTLNAAVGSYSINGLAAFLGKQFILAATAGAYAITGVATQMRRGVRLLAAVGSYSLTGIATTLSRGVRLGAAVGAYTLSGSPITGKLAWRLLATAGSYTLTGAALVAAYFAAPAPYIRKVKAVLQKLRASGPTLGR